MYTEREREREREKYIHIYIYVYINEQCLFQRAEARLGSAEKTMPPKPSTLHPSRVRV